MAKKGGLGSGLDALFGEEARLETEETLRMLPLAHVEPNEKQPRETFSEEYLDALTDSVAEHGVIQPITVRRLSGDRYQIVAGERRWRAARAAGLTELPCRIVEADDRECLVLALVENLQRQDLNPVEQARGLRALLEEYGYTQETAAQQVGCSRPALANALRLLSLPEAVLAMLEEGSLSAGHGRALLGLKDASAVQETAEAIVKQDLSVRQAEELVRRLNEGPRAVRTRTPDIYTRALEERLTTELGRKVHIHPGAKKGRLEIEYYGNEDLETLLQRISHVPAE